MKRVAISIICIIFFPASALASVSITEIMYDLEGTDTDREWIEVYNEGDSVDLSTWKFFEASTNHGLVLSQGSSVISSGSYAIIAQNPSVFLTDHPSFSGTVFDSSFSLGNETGETISIKDSSLSIVDEATYSPENGANGDGNSLSGSGSSWSPSSPTPGGESGGGSTGEEGTTSSGSITSVVNEEGETVVMQDSWSVDISSPSYVSIGNSAKFEVTIKDLYFRIIHPGYFVWNMGDGTIYEGSGLEEVEHTYLYPGEYVIYVEYYKEREDPLKTSGRKTINVVETNISLSFIERAGYLDTKITNNSSRELDMSFWNIVSNGKSYTLPKNTILLPNKSIIIPSRVTGFTGNTYTPVSLFSFANDLSPVYTMSSGAKKSYTKTPSQTSAQVAFAEEESVPSEDKTKNFLEKENLVADVSSSPFDTKSLPVLAFVCLLLLSSASVLYIRNQKREETPSKNSFSADDFELLE